VFEVAPWKKGFLEILIDQTDPKRPGKRLRLKSAILGKGVWTMNLNGWPLDRILVLFVSLAFLMLSIQVTLFHYRQNFHHKSMWIPVIAGPLFFLAGLGLALYPAAWLSTLFLVFMWVGVLDGLIGFYFHFRGVGIRVGGYELRNFLIGPPVVLPLMFTALSVLGLVAVYWR
jgi:hypothetical protein